MNKKIIIILDMILIISLLLNGCLWSPEQQAIEKEAIKLGKEAVGPYLKNKYGMENVTIKNVRADISKNSVWGDSSYTGNAYVECKFDGREFEVLITKDRGNSDNYQYQEIISAIEEYLGNLLGYATYVNNINIINKYFGPEEYFEGTLSSFFKNIIIIYADMYILTDNNIMTIQDSSDKLIDFVGTLEKFDDISYYRRNINAYFFSYSHETAPELDILQEEVRNIDKDIFSESLLAHIFFTTGGKPKIEYCHESIDKSELFK